MLGLCVVGRRYCINSVSWYLLYSIQYIFDVEFNMVFGAFKMLVIPPPLDWVPLNTVRRLRTVSPHSKRAEY